MTRSKISWIIIIVLAIALKIFSLFPDLVEQYYSNGIYRVTSAVQRFLFGRIPFSVGDVLYFLAGIYLLYKLIRMIVAIRKRKTGKTYWLQTLRSFVFVALTVYVLFNLLWGLNYNRLGVAHQLGLVKQKVFKEDLTPLMHELTVKLNKLYIDTKRQRDSLSSWAYLSDGAIASFKETSPSFPFFGYPAPSVKPSLFRAIGNYMGYTGYYNPFTGEAQVNTTVPLFIQPFTICHEIGHQLGYAKENEANFAGYLSAKSSTDPLFRYSVYFELYSYSRPYMYLQDSIALGKLDSQLQPGVKQDFRALRDFYRSHENPMEKVIDRLYGQFLRANEQPAGKLSYSQVIIWLIAYYKKYGKDAL
ncbi:MAG: DUF3810 domain-containing protein [Chitinophagaceae bacterium]|nr:DUF3810 domain-containing protein [Chitinophagaceae bacterium]